MTGKELNAFLKERSITKLYHANAVVTALTYLNENGLLSRGAVEERGLYQETQLSDDCDKKYGIWHDIFLDSVDIHSRSKRINNYGPVLFVLNTDFLDNIDSIDIQITKSNPFKCGRGQWDNIDIKERYISDVAEFEEGNFSHIITLRNMHDVLPFNPYLKKIIIENPYCEDQMYIENAQHEISSKISILQLNCEIEIRSCPLNCNCKQIYGSMNSNSIWHKFRTS